jgi:hypothetical protein
MVDAPYEPVVGAALLALEEVRGGPSDVETLRAVRQSSERQGLLRMVAGVHEVER